jgi:CxxC motif-containing protein (DUF1111 family)
MGSRVSLRIGGVSLLVLGSLAFTPIGSTLAPDFGQPLAGLTADQLEQFDAGKDEFEEVETVDDGIGPIFNDVSCGSCHGTPAIGGGSETLETRFGKTKSNGKFDPLSQFGGSLIQKQGIGGFGTCMYLAEIVPSQATITADRRTTPLFGLGLVDATPDQTFWDLANAEKCDPDTAGKVSVVTNITTGLDAVGKFGWKCQNPTLFQFSGDAYLNEMGITSPQFPDENCPQGDCGSLSCNPMPGLNDDGSDVQAFADFMTFLAPPPRGPITHAVNDGEDVFDNIGCVSCHTATLRTGPNAVAALNKVKYHPYSDFLLHDMGSLGDKITQNLATGKYMRTAPLWGARKLTTLLHDGSAKSLDEAILAHAGQGKKARNKYAGLPSWKKTNLIAFLNSL